MKLNRIDFQKYQSCMRFLDRFAFLDDFISFGREFQIFEPEKLNRFSPQICNLTSGTNYDYHYHYSISLYYNDIIIIITIIIIIIIIIIIVVIIIIIIILLSIYLQ